MFFILSKILFILLVPFWWIVFLLAWMLLSRSATVKKRLKIVIIVLLLVCTNPYLYRMVVSAWQPAPVTLNAGKSFSAGIVLGGLAGYDKYERGYFSNNADRFIQVANLYHRGIIKKIIITGGTGKLQQNEPPEAFFLREQMIFNGIPASDILIESRSRNTYENAVFTKKMIDSLQMAGPYVLVTSAMHKKRSVQVFRKTGYDLVVYPCDYKVVPAVLSIDNTLLPNVSLLNEWANILKEMIGLLVYRATGKA